MKKIIYFLILSFAVTITSCDYVANPYPAKNVNVSDTTSCSNTPFAKVTTHIKKILIEDYTGHTCPNCPRALRAIHSVDSTYPGKIISIGIHVGSLAAPSPGYNSSPANAFTSDYRTATGNVYDALFGASNYGLPEGMFNRKDFDAVNNTHLKLYSDFLSYTSTIVNEPSVVDLQINLNYDPTSHKTCCTIKDSFLTSLSGTYRLTALIVQDSIIDWQDDVDHGINSSYVFRDMLRDAITPTGAWGEPLISGSVSAGTTQIRHFAYTVPTAYTNIPVVISHCYIVAFIYNTATYEIIQSERAKITPK